jgi:hypothetical protein
MIHAELLLLMLEAANADLVSTNSLKRSTPEYSAIHKPAGRLSYLSSAPFQRSSGEMTG